MNRERSLGVTLSVVHRLGSVFVTGEMRRRGISSGQHAYLLAIHEGKARSQEQLAAFFHVDKANVTRAIARLHAAGLVSRVVEQDDRRSYRLSLTPAGMALVPIIRRVLSDWDAILRSGLTPADNHALDHAIARVAANARDRVRGHGPEDRPRARRFTPPSHPPARRRPDRP